MATELKFPANFAIIQSKNSDKRYTDNGQLIMNLHDEGKDNNVEKKDWIDIKFKR